MIEVEIDDSRIQAALRQVREKVENPSGLLKAIGQTLMVSTKERFHTGMAPDGSRWQENSPTTILEYLRRRNGIHDKATGKRIGTKDGYYIKRGEDKGRLTKKSAGILAAKKPLIGDGRALSLRINYDVVGDSVLVGTPEEYGAMQQFGGKKSQFPNLWGDIPARPFMGLSDYDRDSVLDQVRQFLELK